MSRSVVVPLYRRVLKLVAAAQASPAAAKIAEARWAEYLPSSMRIERDESMRSVVRRCFVRSAASPESVADGFAFLREASSSFLGIELLALWDDIADERGTRSGGAYNLSRGIALISAAMDLCQDDPLCGGRGAETCTPGLLGRTALAYENWMRKFVDGASPSGEQPPAATVKSLTEYSRCLQADAKLRRNDSRPEDFTLVSALRRGEASESLLNILLFLKLEREAELSCCPTGIHMAFPWVRAQKADATGAASKGSAVFVSWSYGAMTKADVERRVPVPDKQWSFPYPTSDPERRKEILIVMLKKQLTALSSSDPGSVNRLPQKLSLCKEQFIYLLR